ncbi:hypothetical protein JW752_02650 [Candidatus Peregrinibacteria bacterium]|nr:hypothetical protein [Candidatus Peregrinibacteria bacterium]
MDFILKKIGLFFLVIFLFFGNIFPAHAQDSLFDDPLGAIKERLEEEDIKVADYSETDWGNLPPEVIEILELEGAQNLDDVAGLAEYDQATGNVDALVTYLEGMTFIDGTPFDSDTVNLIVNEIRFRGESQIQSVVLSIVKVFRNLLGSLAIIWIVIAGIRMVMASGNEETINEQKSSIIYAMIGLAIVLVLERLIVLIYGVPGAERGVVPEAGAGIDEEILGFVSFIKALIGAVAILMIIISGYRTIAATGEEEKITEQKRSVLWIAIGLVIIAVNQLFVENLYIRPVRETGGEITTGNVENVIATIGTMLQFILGFVGLVTFAALIYGAASMIANYGNDEMVQSAKNIIKNAIIGIIIILSAFALVSTLML